MTFRELALTVAATLLVGGCESDHSIINSPDPLATLTIANPSSFARSSEAIYVEGSLLGLVDGQAVTFKDQDSVVSSQWVDRDGNGTLESVAMIADLEAAATHFIEVYEGAPPASATRVSAEISIKHGGEWQGQHYEGGEFTPVESLITPPQYTDHSEYIRYEGPGIESEEVGYRLYLDWRNGLDVFAKTKPALVLDQVGLDGYDSYHQASDWGMDVLKVGQSAGIGGFGAWQNEQVQRVSAVASRGAFIKATGPSYAQYDLVYEQWNTSEQSLDLSASLAMTAGSRLVENRVNSNPQLKRLAVTLPKHPEAQVMQGNVSVTGEAWSYLASYGPQAMNKESLGLVVFFKRRQFDRFAEDEHNEVVVLKSNAGDFRYYFGAVWGSENGSSWAEEDFKTYIGQQVERLTLKPRVSIDSVHSREQKHEFDGLASDLATVAAEAEILRHDQEMAFGSYDTMRSRQANWEYTTGLLTQAIYEHGDAVKNAKLKQWARGIIDSYITDDGMIRSYEMAEFNIDRINSGKMLLRLYKDTGEQKYWQAAGLLREQLRQHPKLDAGAYWHKKRYPYQLWLDGVYMAMPFLAEYALMTEDEEAIEQVIHEFEVAREYMRDAETGLYYHAWDESKQQDWANSETGLSSYFWGRGMGWFAMALADTLDILQSEPTERTAPLRQIANELATDIVKYRSEKGLWYQIVDQAERIGNYEESSVSTMFTYFLAKGYNLGVLSEVSGRIALESYTAIVDDFVLVDREGQHHLTQVCQVGGLGYGRDGSYEYYMSEPVVNNDPKGLGPYVMLGRQTEQLQHSLN